MANVFICPTKLLKLQNNFPLIPAMKITLIDKIQGGPHPPSKNMIDQS